MKILVLNSGSSSVKYSVFDMETEAKLAVGRVEKIGTANASIHHHLLGRSPSMESSSFNHDEGLEAIFRFLADARHGVFQEIDENGRLDIVWFTVAIGFATRF